MQTHVRDWEAPSNLFYVSVRDDKENTDRWKKKMYSETEKRINRDRKGDRERLGSKLNPPAGLSVQGGSEGRRTQ